MRPPVYLIENGIHALPCIGDGRQSGTSASPSILNASPEAAVGGGLALLRTGDRVRIDVGRGEANMLVPEDEIARRRAELLQAAGTQYPASQTPWQAIHRANVGQLGDGAILEGPKNSSGSPKKPEYLAIIIEIGERLFLLPRRKSRSTPEFVRSDQRAIVGDARSVLVTLKKRVSHCRVPPPHQSRSETPSGREPLYVEEQL
jgi:hypothetical protein